MSFAHTLPPTKILCRPQDILAAAVPAASPSLAWDATVSEAKEDHVQTQTQHKKVTHQRMLAIVSETDKGADRMH